METEKSTENVWKAEQKNKENVENQAYQISQERALEMLEELLEQDQFELLLPEYKLVYMMNDAVESFLVFHGARMTGIIRTIMKDHWMHQLPMKMENMCLWYIRTIPL